MHIWQFNGLMLHKSPKCRLAHKTVKHRSHMWVVNVNIFDCVMRAACACVCVCVYWMVYYCTWKLKLHSTVCVGVPNMTPILLVPWLRCMFVAHPQHNKCTWKSHQEWTLQKWIIGMSATTTKNRRIWIEIVCFIWTALMAVTNHWKLPHYSEIVALRIFDLVGVVEFNFSLYLFICKLPHASIRHVIARNGIIAIACNMDGTSRENSFFIWIIFAMLNGEEQQNAMAIKETTHYFFCNPILFRSCTSNAYIHWIWLSTSRSAITNKPIIWSKSPQSIRIALCRD